MKPAAAFMALFVMASQSVAQEATQETTGALPEATSTPPVEERGVAVDQAPPSSSMRFLTKAPVKVLASPSSSASVLYGFPPGRPVLLIGRDAGFAQIQDLNSGATGWIDENALEESAPSAAASVTSEPTLAPSTTASTHQDARPRPRPTVRQGPISGFLGGLFGTR